MYISECIIRITLQNQSCKWQWMRLMVSPSPSMLKYLSGDRERATTSSVYSEMSLCLTLCRKPWWNGCGLSLEGAQWLQPLSNLFQHATVWVSELNCYTTWQQESRLTLQMHKNIQRLCQHSYHVTKWIFIVYIPHKKRNRYMWYWVWIMSSSHIAAVSHFIIRPKP